MLSINNKKKKLKKSFMEEDMINCNVKCMKYYDKTTS